MAQMLFDRDSTDKHLNATRRHMRAAKKIKAGDTLVTNIQPHYSELQAKRDAFGEAAKLRAVIAASREAIDALKRAIMEEKIAEADEEIAQADLRRQYENNYLEARKLFGRVVAEQLFPKLSGAASKTIDVGEDLTTE